MARAIHKDFKLSIIVIEHRLEVVMGLSSKDFVLNFGKLLASGTPAEIVRHEEVTKAYLGEEEAVCSQ